ncbi:MAG: RNA-binding transcriptional accessory protein [Prevotellaceae bacterium]|jgi:uncharacterized protein|nr:RNA-binding transcriptional accessory protein [Prevotellaceae bacterium]
MLQNTYIPLIAQAVGAQDWQVEHTLKLFDEGATVPFISRYRKEATGSLDEVQVADIKHQAAKYAELDERKATILKTIDGQGQLTGELKARIEACTALSALEDLYLPYRPKRRTRATIAREKGLEPLAALILQQQTPDLAAAARPFITPEVPTIEEALAGARDIVAEQISENPRVREALRLLARRESVLHTKVMKEKEQEGAKYTDYFAYSEPLKRIPSHRFLAALRGHNEGFLSFKLVIDEEKALHIIERIMIDPQAHPRAKGQLLEAITDAFRRLLWPSIEIEIRNEQKEKADADAIRIFAENLRQLLLAPPLGQKRVLAIDPGFRTGCKIVCLDEQGNLIHNETIYPHPPQNERSSAMRKINALVEAYRIDAIAVGNGTAGRETELFLQKMVFTRKIQVFVVSEDGASIYSASPIAREEFPDYDVTVRGAVSIGRRLMDPLAELVKIDPKSIGVGQYQHDVDQKKLKERLDTVVESCVNSVGVNLNTASKHLLMYVSGLGAQVAQHIVDFRKEHGAFRSREQLMSVKRLGEKAFEQCAGFLRIPDAENPLDNSAVHPERYALVERMAGDINSTIAELLSDAEARKKIDPARYLSNAVGLPTLTDIMNELAKPGRDPRQMAAVFEFAPGIFSIDDLRPGMTLPGIITNITNFGAFVDIGIKQNGLVHVSQLSEKRIANPADAVKLHQHVTVKVLHIDMERGRIALSLKK